MSVGQGGVGGGRRGGSGGGGEGVKPLLPPLELIVRSKRNATGTTPEPIEEAGGAAPPRSLEMTLDTRYARPPGTATARTLQMARAAYRADLDSDLYDILTPDNIFWMVAKNVSSSLRANGVNIYLFDKNTAFTLRMPKEADQGNADPGNLPQDFHFIIIDEMVMKNRVTERVSIDFDELSKIYDTCVNRKTALRLRHKIFKHTLIVPLENHINEVHVVLEMFKFQSKFDIVDEEEAMKQASFGSAMTMLWKQNHDLQSKELLHTYVLRVAESIFKDMDSLNNLMEKIVHYAQDLVQADRASVFLTDSQRGELYATVFDVGFKGDKDFKEIRFPIGTGIAGYVAKTGETLNILDAYEDSRFNREIDQLTGYRTKSLLCMPIYSNNSIIGVVQMVNKKEGSFTPSDVEAFEMFAVYCGLALHNVKLYTKIQRSEQKHKVALEVLSYHNTCRSKEVKKAEQNMENLEISGLYKDQIEFYFNTFILKDHEKALSAVKIFEDLFHSTLAMDRTCLIRFVLTVKKNYRKIPYHNWAHGYSVANTMYNIINKRQEEVFTRNEQLALFVGSLCHDLDHRGKNNKFMIDSESPLAHMYSTSTLEHHHFNQTVVILQQEGHNIFSMLSDNDYKDVLKLLKHCILSTDLVLFFPNRSAVRNLLDSNTFSWDDPCHRNLALAVSMTASDLSASAKPWQVQSNTVKVIFEEFYEQGDAERDANRVPIAMMDRNRPEEQPDCQVGFLQGVCIPCYQILYKLLPATEPLYTMCQKNLEKWQEIANKVQEFKPNKSIKEIQKFLNNLIYGNAYRDESEPYISVGDDSDVEDDDTDINCDISRIFASMEMITENNENSQIDDKNQTNHYEKNICLEFSDSDDSITDSLKTLLPKIQDLDEIEAVGLYLGPGTWNTNTKCTDKDDEDVVTAKPGHSRHFSY